MKKIRNVPYLLLLITLVVGCAPSFTPVAPVVPSVVEPTPTTAPSDTPVPQPTASPTIEPTATDVPTLEPGTMQVSETDGMEMIYIPAGEFMMGSTVGTVDEQPVHKVYLDGYWIDKTEVTKDMYLQCDQAGVCLRPMYFSSNTHYDYYDDPRYANYPIVGLKWSSAETYCNWAGRRLPTEAEWEKAAVGTDGRTYPWGNNPPTAELLNFNNPVGDILAVTEFPFGASPFGVLNMAGNVSEWVADWYAADYYSNSPVDNPTGPLSGVYKVLRGSSWHSDEYLVRSADRFWSLPDARDVTNGFRCAMTP
jgi:formylglycine-generating enzyme required for sulfatase activity